MKAFLTRFWKLIGTVLGAATGAGVLALLATFGVSVDAPQAAAIAAGLAAVGTVLAPSNKPKTDTED